MKLGAVQYCLGREPALFTAAGEIGLEGLELGFGEPNDRTADAAGRAELRAEAEAAGVAIPSLMLGVLNRGGFASADASVRDGAHQLVLASLDAAQELGAKVVLVPFFFQAAPRDEAAFGRLVAHFRQLAPLAAERELVLAYEGELPADDILRLIEQVGSDALRCYYDVGNAVWLGYDPLDEIPRLLPVIAQVHVKEFSEKLNDRPLGEGKVPVAEALEALRASGYDGWVVLETGTFGDPRGATQRAAAYVRQLL